MPCEWKTINGHRVRMDRVRDAALTTMMASFSVFGLLGELQAKMISGSPTFTADELKDAVIRLWLDAERGYVAEVRRHPSLPPVYRAITQADADKLVARRPDPHFLANLFDWPEVPDQ